MKGSESINDVTKHKAALLGLVDNSPDIIALYSVRHGCLYVNEAVRELGLLPASFIGKKLEDMPLSAEQREYLLNKYNRVVQTGAEKEFYYEYELSTGKEHYITRVIPEFNETGTAVETVMFIARNITHHKKIENEMIKQDKFETVQVLAGGIAHDFNNFLTAITGNLSMLKHQMEDNVIRKRIENMETVSFTAAKLTGQLFSFAKGMESAAEDVNAVKLVEENVNFSLSGTGVSPIFSFADDELIVRVDSGQLAQVINNLVINAYQAMPDGGKVKVTADITYIDGNKCQELSLKQGPYVKISIADEGCGIPDEIKSKIFDPFFTTKENGNGLGLLTSYSIVKNHCGHIVCESEQGKGTTFNVFLPAAINRAGTDYNQDDGKIIYGRGRVLVMDDEKPVREAVGEMLVHLGYDVEYARDGFEALWLYKNAREKDCPFDVVILDLTIPGGMGGKSTIRKLLEDDPAAKAVIISGYSHDPVIINYRDYGFQGVLKKPCSIKKISGVMHEILLESNRDKPDEWEDPLLPQEGY